MKWFPFQGVIFYAEGNIECTLEHLKLLLKLFSMFKINIIFDETIDNEDISESVEIMYISCGNFISCPL